MKPKIRAIIWFIMIFIMSIIAIIVDLKVFKNLFTNLWFHIICFPLGVALMWFVITVSKNTGRTLAKYGRKGNIPRLETNVLVDKGPYQYMRHPMHFGLMFLPLAWGLLLGSPTFILIIAPIEISFILLMIKLVEEPETKRKFGNSYEIYAKDKPWFCIKWKCIKALLKKVEK